MSIDSLNLYRHLLLAQTNAADDFGGNDVGLVIVTIWNAIQYVQFREFYRLTLVHYTVIQSSLVQSTK